MLLQAAVKAILVQAQGGGVLRGLQQGTPQGGRLLLGRACLLLERDHLRLKLCFSPCRAALPRIQIRSCFLQLLRTSTTKLLQAVLSRASRTLRLLPWLKQSVITTSVLCTVGHLEECGWEGGTSWRLAEASFSCCRSFSACRVRQRASSSCGISESRSSLTLHSSASTTLRQQ